MNTDKQVIRKISECIAALGGQSDILSVVNSWKDSLTDKEVIEELDIWLQSKAHMMQSNAELNMA